MWQPWNWILFQFAKICAAFVYVTNCHQKCWSTEIILCHIFRNPPQHFVWVCVCVCVIVSVLVPVHVAYYTPKCRQSHLTPISVCGQVKFIWPDIMNLRHQHVHPFPGSSASPPPSSFLSTPMYSGKFGNISLQPKVQFGWLTAWIVWSFWSFRHFVLSGEKWRSWEPLWQYRERYQNRFYSQCKFIDRFSKLIEIPNISISLSYSTYALNKKYTGNMTYSTILKNEKKSIRNTSFKV